MNTIYSVVLSSTAIKAGIILLQAYLDKYTERLSGKCTKYIKQILMVLKRFQSDCKKLGESFLPITELLMKLELAHMNFFKILRFISESRISNKLLGFQKKLLDGNQQESHPIRQLESFLACIANPDEDGRVLCLSETETDVFKIKYLLLNPSKKFETIASEAKSVIFAGGTMSPLDDFLLQLLPTIPKKDLEVFSCGHVIPSNQLCALICSKGVCGKELDFSFANRNDVGLINEAGNTIINYANIIPGGIVVFFPSYSFLNEAVGRWRDSQIISRLSRKKQVFVESRQPGSSILTEYSASIKKSGGAIMFAVVGGSLSEGINFSDDLGRAVIIVGIPFANVKAPEMVERMKHIDNQKIDITGSEYYENICMKSVNQCIGESIFD